jgi:hypothetical protein
MEPAIKRALHARLVSEGRSLKDWFLECAESYLNPAQTTLRFEIREPPSPPYIRAERKEKN